ncbi:ferritin-like domain-containing protein [Sciscionella sediminilitoris]|uniref:ferritin-like domain-containing protein n=1 Tax=Sciscionella sediminilitoris TaxID=1445613 RepID=UPI0004DF144E|nr:ferritin-like domain-containing protein [Sciscionella sp. SE31]
MSYLGYPRVNFAGKYQSDISTVNNALRYYNNDTFEPRFQRPAYFTPKGLIDENGLFNPRGTGDFRLSGLTVRSGLSPDGTLLEDRSKDPVVGMSILEGNRRVSAKMVDIDQRDQTVPGIYGLCVRIVDDKGRELLTGEMEPTWVEDLWRRGPGDQTPGGTNASAMVTSVLTDLRWADDLPSALLHQLRENTTEDLLSIRFTMDGYEIDLLNFGLAHTYGRLVGSIGPYHSGEPRRFVAGRRLRPVTGKLSDTAVRADDTNRTVFLDFSNSWPTKSKGGPPADLGSLSLAVLDDKEKPTVLAPLPRADTRFLEDHGGIAAIELTAEQFAAIADRRLAVVDAASPPAAVLAESSDGTWIHADTIVHRLYPAKPYETSSATVHVTKFGRPAPGFAVTVSAPKPTPALTFPATLTTDHDGRAELALTAKPPPSHTFIDGVATSVLLTSPARSGQPDARVAALIFNEYDAPDRPTWNRDVRPIFQQYANLYPVMGGLFDLANYNHVVEQKTYIRRTMTAPVESPTYMPVSRDLSPRKRDMIMNWLQTKPAPPILEITSREELLTVLQQAMLTELAVIPPYSAALFSIKPGFNKEIRQLIRGVLLEEMQHMAQVCNIINAVGGKPQIGRPGLVPTYPGRLPGPVLPDLTVRLRKLSPQHVKDVFMAIEQPEHPMVDGKPFRGAVIAADEISVDKQGNLLRSGEASMRKVEEWFSKAEYTPMTIGWFYNQIAKAIIRFDDGRLFTGDPARQVGWPDAPGTLFRVTDKRTALLGILQIIEQGEGSPHDLDGDNLGDPEELGHYYRFAEIVHGRQLMRNGEGKWVYEGPEIPFDPEGVYPVVDDADSYSLPADSLARRESLKCDESYTNMLAGLNRVFNGHPGEMDDAVALMGQLQVQAKRLYEIPAAEGSSTVAGPAFQSPAPR